MTRFLLLLSLWFVLDGVTPAGLALGAVAAGLATWASFRLAPASRIRLRVLPLFSLVLYFLRSSVVAGVDVAWRAFHPRLPLRPGFVTCPCRIPPGTTREVLQSLISLMPGSVSAADEDGRIIVHCLDTGQAVAAQFADTEARLRRAVEDRSDV